MNTFVILTFLIGFLTGAISYYLYHLFSLRHYQSLGQEIIEKAEWSATQKKQACVDSL